MRAYVATSENGVQAFEDKINSLMAGERVIDVKLAAGTSPGLVAAIAVVLVKDDDDE